jgi:4-amino-4-deoxy-L-arabinose transferase-like glycosyltransferase
MINVVFSALLLISVYAIGKMLANGKAGLLAAVLVASYPPIIHLSHIYRPHFAVAACAALSMWLLLLLLRDGSTKVAWLFGGSLAFGVLIHPNFV